MANWLDPQPVLVPGALQAAVGGLPLVAETLARRGILTPQKALAYLDPDYYTPADPAGLPDLELAVERLRESIRRGERIAIWGDFDADGQTATALLWEALRALGADVVYRVPTRQEGHGLHRAGLERLIEEGARLILTCDTGVTAHETVEHARRLGAEVIITDHHVPGQSLPPALAVVNPHRLPPGHPLETLPGVGVAYQVARALDPEAADRGLDLVALGTVADVATLVGDTRYLVQRGLEALRRTERPGLQAVYTASGLRPEGITEEHIGFMLGPRLNALGRLDDAAKGVELLTTEDSLRARILANEVEGLNSQRQWLTRQVTEAALAQIEREPRLLSDYEALVLSHPTWPGGIIGIVAGRLAERFGKPAALISAPEGDLARGSARSIPGVDLIAAIDGCQHLLESFGGHAGAAGFSLKALQIPEFRAALSRAVGARMEGVPEPALAIDAYVDLSGLSLELVEEINRLAPFGAGNPPLTLAVRDLEVTGDTTIGRTGEHRRVTVEDQQDRSQTVFWWQGVDQPLPQGRFDLALTVRASDYKGAAEVQVEWIEAREQEPEPIPVAEAIPVRDFRGASDPLGLLRELAAEGALQVWAEAEKPSGVESRRRHELEPGPTLAIWTAPPGSRVLRAVLGKARPQEVILFARDPHLDEAQALMERLGGLVNYALGKLEGQMDLERAAAATAQRASTVQAGLELLALQGKVSIEERGVEVWRLAPPGSRDRGGSGEELRAARLRLEVLLGETGAYRKHFQTAPAESLVRH